MPQVWRENDESHWAALPLVDDVHPLTEDGLLADRRPAEDAASLAPITLLRYPVEAAQRWVLVAQRGTAVSVNGAPLTTGIRDLRDKDEILFSEPAGAARRVYFSTEQLARIEPFPEGLTARCPRCREPLEPGEPSVRCPTCHVFHHEGKRRCWTYSELCAACQNQKTALDQGFRWTPEEI